MLVEQGGQCAQIIMARVAFWTQKLWDIETAKESKDGKMKKTHFFGQIQIQPCPTGAEIAIRDERIANLKRVAGRLSLENEVLKKLEMRLD